MNCSPLNKQTPSTLGWRPRAGRIILAATLLAPSLALHAATIVWNGVANTNSAIDWSTAGNWAGSVAPGSGDDAKFFNAGAIPGISNINNTVDSGFGGTIGSLQYGSTNGFHTTLIASGVTLNIVDTNGLSVGTPSDIGISYTNRATITGPGATLNVNNTAAVIALNQGTATSVNFPQAILDMSGLDNFNANANRIGIGTTTAQNPSGIAQREAGTLYLAKTNNITLSYSLPLSAYLTGGKTNAIELARNPGNNGGSTTMCYLYLGITNVLNVDSIGVGRDKSDSSANASMLFNPAFAASSPVAYFYGVSGPGSRVTWWGVGDANANSSSSHGGWGTNDFTAGTIYAYVNTMSLGRDESAAASTWAGPDFGAFKFNAGKVDVNTLILGNQSLWTSGTTATTPNVGVMTLNGTGTLLSINTNLTLGATAVTSVAATNSYGTLNVTNGTVYANNVTVGAYSTSPNNAINLVNGTLVVTNTLATNGVGLAGLYLSNSTLGLTVHTNSSLVCLVKTLTTAGTANQIQLAPAPAIFASYPTQFALVKFTTWNGANNFNLATVPAWAPGALLVSNGPNKTLDLLLPNDPRPVVTSEPASYSGSPGDTVTFTVAVSGNSATPLTYQWYNGSTALTDGVTGSGSTISGSATSSLVITGAQPGDNGNYSVVIANAYGTATSAPLAVLTISAGSIPPSISGLTNITVIQGNNGSFNATVSGSPVPSLQWLDQTGTPIIGATSSTLLLTSVQYSQNGYTYSLVASNSANVITNSATLTVIVPPSITTQPASLVVTNTQSASLTVVATGVPNPTYQWYVNGSPISVLANPSATNATLSFASVAASNTASYYVQVSNAAGTTNSATVSLTVNSTMSTVASIPANGQTNVTYDTPLYVTFSTPPVLNNAGKIRIYNVTNSITPVDTLDMSQNVTMSGNAVNVQPYVIGTETFTNFPVTITGNQAAIYLHHGVLSSNQTYYVTIDDGVFADTAGAFFAGIAANVWQFSTKTGGPANVTNLVVAQDYSGDFATVQGAIDSTPAANTTPTVINIHNGIYTEVVVAHSKNNLLLRGQSRSGTILTYANNSNLNGSTHSRMAFHVNANDIALDNLTVTNATIQDSSQAEALMIDSGAARIIINNCNVDSYQDTILANISSSKAYFNNSLIQGDVDFIWGGGNLFFTNCQVLWLMRVGNSQGLGPNPSPGASDLNSNGFSFVNCVLNTQPGIPNDVVGRTRSITNGNTALIDCLISSNIGGWYQDAVPTNLYRNWYYNCSNLMATASVTLSNGIPLGATDPNVALASSATTWLYGWQPQLSPNILTNPASVVVTAGSPASFSVAATGIPDPTYQWLENGTNVPNATNNTLVFASPRTTDSGLYSVIVTTSSGQVTSTTATLTVNAPPNTPPVFINPPTGTNIIINAGVNLSVPCTATNTDATATTLTYSLLAGPAGASLDPSSGIFAWRPTVAEANSTNAVQVAVTDNGSVILSATNNFTVTVNPVVAPTVGSFSYTNGLFSLIVTSGTVGPDYILQGSTNLFDWMNVQTNSSSTLPFTIQGTNAASYPTFFYRVQLSP